MTTAEEARKLRAVLLEAARDLAKATIPILAEARAADQRWTNYRSNSNASAGCRHRRALIAEIDRIRATIGSILEAGGCTCPCDHHYSEHEDDCEICGGCQIAEEVMTPNRAPRARKKT